MKCEICKRKIEGPPIHFMFTELLCLGKECVKICNECDISLHEQIFMIADELTIPEPHILKTSISFSPNTHQIGLLFRIPKEMRISTPTQYIGGKTKNGHRRKKKI